MKKIPDKKVEKVAAAIIGSLRSGVGERWSRRWIATAKWPKDFYPSERREARKVARKAIVAFLKG